jgi:prephenate dehydrogenase
VAIVGAGLIGGSIGMALRERRLAGEVIAVARSEETIRLALARGAADRATRDIAGAAAGADLVVLAAPVSLIAEHLQVVAAVVDAECVITDVGSVKQPIAAAAEKALPHPGRFVGGHPLAGSERKGIAAARPDLLQGATWVLTPTARTDAAALERVQDLVARLGARSLLLSPQEHDHLVARTSHLPHLVAAALIHVVAARIKERADTLDVIGQGFRDTTRIAAGDAALWADIALANADALLDSLGEMNAALECLAAALKARSREDVERFLGDAQRAKEGM